MKTITVTALKQALSKHNVAHLIDVRTAAEFHSERADTPVLKNHPLNQLDTLDIVKDAPIHLFCQSGNRSEQACQQLLAAGYTQVINVEGGLNAWKKHKYPVTKTQGTFPIMRQVQIAAGSLVLIGTMGSLLIHPSMIWLAAFVGAGLTFAGLSGFCGMAILLAKMPWNATMKASA